jgi:transposase
MPSAPCRGGGRWRDHHQVLTGLFWKLVTGAQWRDIPERYGPWQTIYERYTRWRDEGLFDRILERLQVRLDAEGRIDPELWCVDSTHVRASRSAAGAGKRGGPLEPADHALGLRRGGIWTKIHLVTDSNGIPLAAVPSPGQRHEIPVFPVLMDSIRIPRAKGSSRRRPRRLAGDRAYGHEPVFIYLRRRGTGHVIPQRSAGVWAERAVSWLKGCRSIAIRHEKLATSFMAMLKLAFIPRYLRLLRTSDRTQELDGPCRSPSKPAPKRSWDRR